MRRSPIAFLLLSLAACSSTETSGFGPMGPDVVESDVEDAAVDTGADDVVDAAADITVDVAPDVALDTTVDVTLDTGRDVLVDTGIDVVRDAGIDVASDVCAGDRCATMCAAGTGDCDGNTTNGCETSLSTSALNCGACGRACPMGQACVAGVCAPVLCPPSCMSNSDCSSCSVPGDPGQFCCISGLCLYSTMTCGGPAVDGPTMGDATGDGPGGDAPMGDGGLGDGGLGDGGLGADIPTGTDVPMGGTDGSMGGTDAPSTGG